MVLCKMAQNWTNIKASGSFRRKVKNNLKSARPLYVDTSDVFNTTESTSNNSTNPGSSVSNAPLMESHAEETFNEEYADGTPYEEDCESDECDADDSNKDLEFISELKKWALHHNIKLGALGDLMVVVNKRLGNVLPKDPRTLLNSSSKPVDIINICDGEYWHQGLKHCLQCLKNYLNQAMTISINVNMDGLPTYKSSKNEFWPILFNIYEMPHISPMIIGIYCGKGKPSDVNAYLKPFVDEMKDVLENGVYVNEHKINVTIRCFICDSPARAFIKGTANFNSQNGCIKCTTEGEYSYLSHCNIFPRYDCTKRTDEDFRAKTCPEHHKNETLLLQLPIDMIEDFPVADSLHLFDLGIMKRCMLGWRNGSFQKYKTKWSANDINDITKILLRCKLPAEIHRAVRGLDTVAFWKGLEYRTFLYYLGVVVLKNNLPPDAYEHFLLLFCAVTICSSEIYKDLLDLAHTMFLHYIEYYADIYGKQHITSNIHNICHVVDEVKRFGILTTFNAYPFENKLYKIKNMIRSGNKPLQQVAKRIRELGELDLNREYAREEFPIILRTLSNYNAGHESILRDIHVNDSVSFYAKIIFKTFMLSNNNVNGWFLTKCNEIVRLKCVINQNGSINLVGCSMKQKKSFFETPIRSSILNIYISNCLEDTEKLYSIDDIKCKLVPVQHNSTNEIIFVPLLHTL